MSRYLLLFLLFSLAPALPAQTNWGAYYGITCSSIDTTEAYLPPPAAFLSGSNQVQTQIELNFTDNVPAIARSSMRFAADIWGSFLLSDVTVNVDVDWEDRMDERLLASAGPATLFRDFGGAVPNTWYAVALAEAIAGRELNDPFAADINVNVNSTANWYFGTDGQTPRSQIDLASVFLHELGHGLGFLSSADTVSITELGLGFGDRLIIYDLFIETEEGNGISDAALFGNPSPELLEAAVSNDLVFDGESAVARNGNRRVPIFAPGTFDVGSSLSHLDEFTYRPGTPNALMTPFLAAGEAAHDIGPVTLGIFEDMGWPLRFDLPVSDRTPEPQAFAVRPNPAVGRVQIDNPFSASATLSVVSTAGRILRRESLPAAAVAHSVDLTGMAPGVYQLLIDAPGERALARVLVR